MDDAQRTERVAELEALRADTAARIAALLAVPGAPASIDFGPLFLETLVGALFPPDSDERLAFDLTWETAKADWVTKADEHRRRATLLAPAAVPVQVPVVGGNGRR